MDPSASQLEPMAPMTDDLDDLDNLFEFGDIDLNNIPDVDLHGFADNNAPVSQEQQQQQAGQHAADMSFSGLGEAAHGFGEYDSQGGSMRGTQRQQQGFLPSAHDHTQSGYPYGHETMYQPSEQQPYSFQQQDFDFDSTQGFPSGHVPPTPNSYEMHGKTQHFPGAASAQMGLQQPPAVRAYQLRPDDMALTPMVSPHGTAQFPVMPEYTTPGAYFSPLSSPMLHGHHHAAQPAHLLQQHQPFLTNPSTAQSSSNPSPVHSVGDVEMGGQTTSLPRSTGPQPRKSRRQAGTSKDLSAAAKTKDPPIRKSTKRKPETAPSSIAPAPQSSTDSPALRAQPGSAKLRPPHPDSSEKESTSPEALSESIMGPPPRPASSLNPSPAITPQQKSTQQPPGPAATPKSLLNTCAPLAGSQSTGPTAHTNTLDPIALPDLALPEAATTTTSSALNRRATLPDLAPNPQLPPSATDDYTQTTSRKTPKLGPDSTPTSSATRSGTLTATSASTSISTAVPPSPSTTASPSLSGTPALIARDGKGASRHAKNRHSASTSNGKTASSPALVPKISPSIKPLLPEGSNLNSTTQALLLASKSNYQNLLDGTAVPGVSYPEALSTGLSSKRTSHKVAEQGRRNRINDALKEMQGLLPKGVGAVGSPGEEKAGKGTGKAGSRGGGGSGEGEKSEREAEREAEREEEAEREAAVKSSSSKAATVEAANEYLRKVRGELEAQGKEVEKLRRENEGLRRRLGERGVEDGAESGERGREDEGMVGMEA